MALECKKKSSTAQGEGRRACRTNCQVCAMTHTWVKANQDRDKDVGFRWRDKFMGEHHSQRTVLCEQSAEPNLVSEMCRLGVREQVR